MFKARYHHLPQLPIASMLPRMQLLDPEPSGVCQTMHFPIDFRIKAFGVPSIYLALYLAPLPAQGIPFPALIPQLALHTPRHSGRPNLPWRNRLGPFLARLLAELKRPSSSTFCAHTLGVLRAACLTREHRQRWCGRYTPECQETGRRFALGIYADVLGLHR